MSLVSIICRTIGRPELQKALNSVLTQSYSPIEIILVNASKADLRGFDTANAGIKVLNPDNFLSRAEAANQGLDAATGDYFMFLDDDDWISSNHVQNLLIKLKANLGVKAVYSSAQKTNPEGLPLDYIFNTKYDPYLLMRDNYIPIHTMLFDSSMINRGCRFDDSFQIYEDWDFWLQLSQYTDFEHIPDVTAFYRSGGDSGTDIQDDSIRFNPTSKLAKARSDIYNKWRSKWTGNQINLLLGNTLRYDLSNNLQHIENRFKEELLKTSKLNETIIELRISNSKIKENLDHASKTVNDKEKYVHKLANHIKEIEGNLAHKIEIEKHLKLHVNQLEYAYEGVIKSRTWRLAAPFRRIGKFFKTTSKELVPADKRKAQTKERNVIANSQKKNELLMDHRVNANSQQAENPKALYSNKAREKLSSFLSSDRNLIFPNIKNPSLSIVLVFYNQPHLGFLCLQSILQKADVSYELVIIDNASDDETNKLLNRIRNAQIARNKDNLGFVRAVNCLLYTSPSPRDATLSRMPSSA